MTVAGYLLEEKNDIYANRIKQIEQYCDLAKERNTDWIK